jgi:zinc/manganese transport system ATP-binding protein
MIKFESISASYGNHVAVENVSFDVKEGGLYAIIGPNGAGKSTLLKAIIGILPLTNGRITIDPSIATHMAYLPQQSHIDRSFPISVFDTVAMGLWQEIGPFQHYPPDATDRVHQALLEVGMSTYINRPIGSLSGGQFQRVLFARMSLQNAGLILLDEPFNNLDEPTIEDLTNIIVQWNKMGKTILTVLHDLDIVRDCFPQAVLLARHLVAFGKTEEVLTVDNIGASYRLARQWGGINPYA